MTELKVGDNVAVNGDNCMVKRIVWEFHLMVVEFDGQEFDVAWDCEMEEWTTDSWLINEYREDME